MPFPFKFSKHYGTSTTRLQKVSLHYKSFHFVVNLEVELDHGVAIKLIQDAQLPPIINTNSSNLFDIKMTTLDKNKSMHSTPYSS